MILQKSFAIQRAEFYKFLKEKGLDISKYQEEIKKQLIKCVEIAKLEEIGTDLQIENFNLKVENLLLKTKLQSKK